MTSVAKTTPDPITTSGARGLLDWVKQYQPYLFKYIQKNLPAGVASGMGIGMLGDDSTDSAPTTTATPDWSATLQSLVGAFGTAYLTKTQVDAQTQIFNAQLERAKAGLPPLAIDPTQFGLPAPTVNLGLSSGTSQLFIYGGAAALLVYLLKGRKS